MPLKRRCSRSTAPSSTSGSAPSGGRPGGLLRAVDGVSLRLAAGETLGIVGESGCGKSTLARLVVGLLEPDQGRIRIRGGDIWEPGAAGRERRRNFQMVFQNPVRFDEPAPHRRRQRRRAAVGARRAQDRRRSRAHAAPGRPEPEDGRAHAARDVGRPAAARLDRARADRQAGAGGARRVGGVAGHLAAGPDPQPAGGTAGDAGHLLPLHQPRPGRGAGHQPPRGRDVPGRDRRSRHRPQLRRAAAASLFRRAAQRDPHARPGARAQPLQDRAARRRAQPDEPAFGLPLPHPLPAGRRRSAPRRRPPCATRAAAISWPATLRRSAPRPPTPRA